MGRTHYPKPDVVVPVVRVVVVAVVSARVVLIVVPRTTAQHARLGHGPPDRFPGELRLAEERVQRLACGKIAPGRASRGPVVSGPHLVPQSSQTDKDLGGEHR